MHGYLLLDMTGSMKGNKQATIDACNEYIDSLKADPKGDFIFSVGVFNTNIGLERVVGPSPIEQVRPFGHENYQPDGGTPLYDAIGEAIASLPNNETAVLFIIQTDGEENSFQKFTRQQILDLVAEKTKLGWQCAYLGCNLDAMAQAAQIGIVAGQTLSYLGAQTGRAGHRLATSSAIYRETGEAATDFMAKTGETDIRESKP